MRFRSLLKTLPVLAVALTLSLNTSGLCAPAASPATGAGAVLTDTQVMDFQSAINGVTYRIYVTRPAGYDGQATYPAMYLLDGDTYFPYMTTLQMRMAYDIPPMLFVSIGYAGKSQRAQDYPSIANSYWKVEAPRGAATFLRILSEEIIPFVEHRYHVDPATRGLGGHSMGGFFTAYALLHKPELFSRYWVSSPSMVWDKRVLFRFEKEQAAKGMTSLNAHVYADIGDLEEQSVIDDVAELGRRMNAHNYAGFNWQSSIEPDLPHIIVPVTALPRALLALYGKPEVPLTAAQMDRIAGRYRLPDGNFINLVTENGKLRIIGCQCEVLNFDKITMLASSPNDFYLRYVGVSVTVIDRAAEKPTQIQITSSFEGQSYSAIAIRENGPLP